MSMLRHLRMTPVKESQRVVSARMQSLIKTWTAPLHAYTVPHQMPRPGEPDRLCQCRYPLFTLCTPRASPYDAGTCVMSPSDVGKTATESDVSSPLHSFRHSGSDATLGAAPLQSKPGRVTWAGQRLWRGRATRTAYRPNIISDHPACYRCDICDGFQKIGHSNDGAEGDLSACASAGHTSEQSAAVPPEGNAVAQGDTTLQAAGASDCATQAEAEEEEEEEELIQQPMSSDITNTFMEDTEIAQRRYQDPFQLEVIGKPHSSFLTRQLVSEFNAQLRRCDLSIKILGTHSRQALQNSALYLDQYRSWTDTEVARKREQSASRDPAQRVEYLRGCVRLFEASAYAARFAAASYGLPYELGYFNSFQDWMMLTAEPHRRYTCATSEEQAESMRRCLQGEVADPLVELVSSRYSIQLDQPCFVLMLDHEARRVVLSFRGSSTLADAVVDVSEGYVEVDLLSPATDVFGVQTSSALLEMQRLEAMPSSIKRRFGPIIERLTQREERADGGEELRTRVPLGFYISVIEASAQLLPALREIYTLYQHYELIVTGHSLGGILASLFHLFFCMPTPDTSSMKVPFARVQTIALAAAPTVEERIVDRLNERLRVAATEGSRLITFAYGHDMVPRLQVRSIRNTLLSTDYLESTSATATGDAADMEQKKVTAAPTRGAPPAYQEISDARLPTLCIPGELYNTPDTLRRCVITVPVDTVWRKQLTTTPESVFHHFPVFYARAIHRLRNYYVSRLQDATKEGRTSCAADKRANG